MSNTTHLLRMLEPAVRPDGISARAPQAPVKPIEAESFDAILDRARHTEVDAPTELDETSAQTPPATQLIGRLARIDQVENESLRGLISSARADA